jgi:hypothetical protein
MPHCQTYWLDNSKCSRHHRKCNYHLQLTVNNSDNICLDKVLYIKVWQLQLADFSTKCKRDLKWRQTTKDFFQPDLNKSLDIISQDEEC